jgi:hypothetical protein
MNKPPLMCEAHDQPLATCDCRATPGVRPMIYKVKPVIKERDKDFMEYLKVPHD